MKNSRTNVSDYREKSVRPGWAKSHKDLVNYVVSLIEEYDPVNLFSGCTVGETTLITDDNVDDINIDVALLASTLKVRRAIINSKVFDLTCDAISYNGESSLKTLVYIDELWAAAIHRIDGFVNYLTECEVKGKTVFSYKEMYLNWVREVYLTLSNTVKLTFKYFGILINNDEYDIRKISWAVNSFERYVHRKVLFKYNQYGKAIDANHSVVVRAIYDFSVKLELWFFQNLTKGKSWTSKLINNVIHNKLLGRQEKAESDAKDEVC